MFNIPRSGPILAHASRLNSENWPEGHQSQPAPKYCDLESHKLNMRGIQLHYVVFPFSGHRMSKSSPHLQPKSPHQQFTQRDRTALCTVRKNRSTSPAGVLLFSEALARRPPKGPPRIVKDSSLGVESLSE